MKDKRALPLFLSSGVLLGLSFPPINLWALAFVAFVPLLYAVELRDGKKVFLPSYLTFFVYCLITNYWVGGWRAGTDPFLMIAGVALSFANPFFFLIPMYFYFSIRKRASLNLALWTFPFIWTAYEWFRTLTELAYPWVNIGYSQTANLYWAQIADLAGVWGEAFIIALINVLIFKIFLTLKSKKETKEIVRKSKIAPLAVAALVLFVLPYIYGAFKMERYSYPNLIKSSKTVGIAVVQPSINPWAKWSGGVMSQIKRHIALQDSLLAENDDFDIAIWTETSIPFIDLYFNAEHNFGILEDWADTSNISILTGFADIYVYEKDEPKPASAKKFGNSDRYYDSYNAAVIINPSYESDSAQIYRKMKLTPFSERFPYEEILSFAKEWFQWGVGISSWTEGKKQFPLILKRNGDSVKIGTIICIESVFPKFVSNYVNLDAEVLTVITNDAWFDYTAGPPQHFDIARTRAIETRRCVARCGNTGVSGFIAPNGEVISQATQYKALAASEELPLVNDVSFYAKTGDWLPLGSALIAICVWLFGKARRRT